MCMFPVLEFVNRSTKSYGAETVTEENIETKEI